MHKAKRFVSRLRISYYRYGQRQILLFDGMMKPSPFNLDGTFAWRIEIVLVIRDRGRKDIVAFHPTEQAAREALADYVREQTPEASDSDSDNDAELIAAYFADESVALYTIAGVPAAKC